MLPLIHNPAGLSDQWTVGPMDLSDQRAEPIWGTIFANFTNLSFAPNMSNRLVVRPLGLRFPLYHRSMPAGRLFQKKRRDY